MIVCPKADCASPNVQDVPHYWQSLPAESPLKSQYAPPPGVARNYWASLGVVGLGFVAAVSGAVMLGLVVIVAGVVWGALLYRFTAEAARRLEAWRGEQVCLACTYRF